MYLYRRSFSCSGPTSVIPHLMAELFDAAQATAGPDLRMWRGVAGTSELDFRWEVCGDDPDALRNAFDTLRGDRATVALLDELARSGWDGRHRDDLGAVIVGDHAIEVPRVGDLRDDREIPASANDHAPGLRWLQQMCAITNDLIGPTDVLVTQIWAGQPSVHLMRTASDVQALIDADIRCDESGAWREARRGAQRHVMFDLAHRTLWRRVR